MNYNNKKIKDVIKKKSFIVFSIILILSISLGAWRNLRKGIYIGENFLYRKNNNYYKGKSDEIRINKKYNTTKFDIIIAGIKKSATVNWSDTSSSYLGVTITFDDGNTIEGYWNDLNRLVDADDNLIADASDIISFDNSAVNNEKKFPISNEYLAEYLCGIDKEANIETRGSIILILLGVFIYICGLISLYWPNEIFFFLNKWRYEKPCLSETGKLVEQISGVVFIIISYIVIYF